MAVYNYLGYGKKFEFDKIKNPVRVKKSLSIVIPSYYEGENLEQIIKKLGKVLAKTKFKESYEIIVVDDSSKDETPKILSRFVKKGNFVSLIRTKRGIFTAVLDGIKIANGKYVLTMDADFSHPPDLIPDMLFYINDYDIVIGSRYVRGGRMEASFTRKWGGFFLNRICGFVIGTNVKDLGGNFRLFKKSEFNKLEFRYSCKFAEFGQELFYRAEQQGLRTKEVPFVYRNRKKGKSKMGNFPLNQAMHYFKRAMQLRLENFRRLQ